MQFSDLQFVRYILTMCYKILKTENACLQTAKALYFKRNLFPIDFFIGIDVSILFLQKHRVFELCRKRLLLKLKSQFLS